MSDAGLARQHRANANLIETAIAALGCLPQVTQRASDSVSEAIRELTWERDSLVRSAEWLDMTAPSDGGLTPERHS